MFERNLPVWERIVRSALGMGAIVVGALWFGWSTMGAVLIASGITLLITAIAARCPVCRIAGRAANDSRSSR